MSTSVDVFIDYVCPFCFLVEPALEELRRDRDVKVNIRPFELRPDPVPTLRPEDDYLPRVWNDLVYPIAERIGIRFACQVCHLSPARRRHSLYCSSRMNTISLGHTPRQCSRHSSRTTGTSETRKLLSTYPGPWDWRQPPSEKPWRAPHANVSIKQTSPMQPKL